MSHSNSDTLLFLPSGVIWKWLSLVPIRGNPLKLFLLTKGFSLSRSLWKLDVESLPSFLSWKLGSLKFLSVKVRSLNSPSEKFLSLKGTSLMPNPPMRGVPMPNLLRSSSSRKLKARFSNFAGLFVNLEEKVLLSCFWNFQFEKLLYKVTAFWSELYFQFLIHKYLILL